MYGGRVLVFDSELELVDIIVHRLMSDLHGVTLTPRGDLLVSSSGIDGLLQLNRSSKLVWSWLAADHGYGDKRVTGRRRMSVDMDYRQAEINTGEQFTHLNSCLQFNDGYGREVVLATLFHQGELIRIDKQSGAVDVLVTGLKQPHSVRRTRTGWSIANSGGDSVVLLDEDFWITEVISSDFNWVQDAVELVDARLLIADANNNRLVIWDQDLACPCEELKLNSEWKVFQVEVVPTSWETAIRDCEGELESETGGTDLEAVTW
jgi:hypothetical protein